MSLVPKFLNSIRGSFCRRFLKQNKTKQLKSFLCKNQAHSMATMKLEYSEEQISLKNEQKSNYCSKDATGTFLQTWKINSHSRALFTEKDFIKFFCLFSILKEIPV